MLLRLLLSMLLLSAGTVPAFADDGPLSAAEVQAQLRSALGPLGGDASPPDRQVRVMQWGDRVVIEWPVYGLMGLTADQADQDVAMTMLGRRVGRLWTIEYLRAPRRVSFRLKERGLGGDRIMTVTRSGQAGYGTIDPTLTTPSFLTLTADGVDNTTLSAAGTIERRQRMEHYDLTAWLRPRGPGRMRLKQELRERDYQSSMRLRNGVTVQVDADRITSICTLDDIETARIPALVGLMYRELGAEMNERAQHAGADTDPAAKTDLAAALDGLSGNISAATTFENMRAGYLDQRLTASFVSVDVSGHLGPDDAGLSVDVTLRDATWRAAPDGRLWQAPLLRLAVSMSGIDQTALAALLHRADERPDAGTSARHLAVVGSGRFRIELKDFAFDVGDVTVSARGVLHLWSADPADADTSGKLVIGNFDALFGMARDLAAIVPAARAVTPALVYLKGLARQEGGKSVWYVFQRRGRLMVNGLDPVPRPEQAGSWVHVVKPGELPRPGGGGAP